MKLARVTLDGVSVHVGAKALQDTLALLVPDLPRFAITEGTLVVQAGRITSRLWNRTPVFTDAVAVVRLPIPRPPTPAAALAPVRGTQTPLW